MKVEETTAYTARYFDGEPGSCSYACPFRMDIRSFPEKVGKGRWWAAYKALRNTASFSAIVSALCDQPCRAHCRRTLFGDEAISVSELEVACLRIAKNRKAESYIISLKTQRIAVVGAGPRGPFLRVEPCPTCSKGFIFEELAEGNMAEVEEQIEDKLLGVPRLGFPVPGSLCVRRANPIGDAKPETRNLKRREVG